MVGMVGVSTMGASGVCWRVGRRQSMWNVIYGVCFSLLSSRSFFLIFEDLVFPRGNVSKNLDQPSIRNLKKEIQKMFSSIMDTPLVLLFGTWWFVFLLLVASPFLSLLAGFEVYLVGGCVRDLILDRTPKDFDILTSAELKEVRCTAHFYC